MTDAKKSRRRMKARKPRRVPAEATQASTPPASPLLRAPSAQKPIDADDFNEAFVRALKADFNTYGDTAIAAMRGEKPVEYVKTVAALCTKEKSDASDPLRLLSDAELARHIGELAQRAGYEIRPLALPHRADQDG
jgi:hypothetical protein